MIRLRIFLIFAFISPQPYENDDTKNTQRHATVGQMGGMTAMGLLDNLRGEYADRIEFLV